MEERSVADAMDRAEHGAATDVTAANEGPPIADPQEPQPWQRPKSRINKAAEDEALACMRRGERREALKILMVAYGTPVTAFALRMLRNAEYAKDVRQQVFIEAFQGIERFENRASLWNWLCGIAYHRCLDERRRMQRMTTVYDSTVWNGLSTEPDIAMDEDRVEQRRALQRCLGELHPRLRAQLLMRYLLGLSHVEIAEIVGDSHGTVQVRISRALPKLRRCLRLQGVFR